MEMGEVHPMRTPGSGYIDTSGGEGTARVLYDVLFRYELQFPSDQIASLRLSLNPTEVPDGVLR